MRTAISRGHLAALVRAELQMHINQEHEFTAYNITRALRASHPNFEIAHASVRELVHQNMSGIINSGQYQACLADFGGRIAILYAPMPVLAALNPALLGMN